MNHKFLPEKVTELKIMNEKQLKELERKIIERQELNNIRKEQLQDPLPEMVISDYTKVVDFITHFTKLRYKTFSPKQLIAACRQINKTRQKLYNARRYSFNTKFIVDNVDLDAILLT
ncbi:MAG: hypothetical protein HC836_41205 [Richelia sp. RM2_1_2]|nr:hypothetical protein [Richelia sp. RM2_1_2]